MTIPHLYPTKESSVMLHVSEDYNRQRLRNKTWPGVKIAGRWYMTEAQIVEAIELSSTEALVPESNPAGLPKNSRFRRRADARRSA